MTGRILFGDEVWAIRDWTGNAWLTVHCRPGCTEHCHSPKPDKCVGCQFKGKFSDGRCAHHTRDGKHRAERQRRRRNAQNEHFVKHARPMNLTSVMRLSLRDYLQLAMVAEVLAGDDA